MPDDTYKVKCPLHILIIYALLCIIGVCVSWNYITIDMNYKTLNLRIRSRECWGPSCGRQGYDDRVMIPIPEDEVAIQE